MVHTNGAATTGDVNFKGGGGNIENETLHVVIEKLFNRNNSSRHIPWTIRLYRVRTPDNLLLTEYRFIGLAGGRPLHLIKTYPPP